MLIHNHDAVRILVGLEDKFARDELLTWALDGNPEELVVFLSALARCALADNAAPICSALACVAYQMGNGALANIAVERALKALNLLLQAGGFGVVAIDLADAPAPALRTIPFTTWLRVQRTIEGSDTACIVLAPRPLARSAGGVTLALDARPAWDGRAGCSRRLAGLTTTVRLIAPHRRAVGSVVASPHP